MVLKIINRFMIKRGQNFRTNIKESNTFCKYVPSVSLKKKESFFFQTRNVLNAQVKNDTGEEFSVSSIAALFCSLMRLRLPCQTLILFH